MLDALTKHIIQHYKWVTGATSLMALFSVGSHAEDQAKNDIKLWLKEPAPEAAIQPDETYYDTEIISTHSINASSPPVTLELDSHGNVFAQSQKKIRKANEKKWLKKLGEKFKVRLYKNSGLYSSHNIYINALKGELVGKSRFGRAKYEFRISEKSAQMQFRYSF